LIENVERQGKIEQSVIEPLIDDLKLGHRLGRNFLSIVFGDTINVVLAATGNTGQITQKTDFSRSTT
jgi:hypothetical protein